MWSNKYLGIPYKSHGRDEVGIDCWGLVRLVYKQEYNIDLPSFSESYLEGDRARSEELIAQYREGWEQLDGPQEGCVVVLRVMGHLSHIGVCINERQFLHAQEGSGSSVQDFDGIKWSRRVAGYFKYRENSSVVLNAVPHPLKTERVVMPVVPGTNLEELYQNVLETNKIPQTLKSTIHIFVNGVLVPRVVWNTTVLQQGDVVEYRSVAQRETARLILTLVVAYVAYTIAGPAGVKAATAAGYSAATAQVIGAVAAATTVVAGTALINAVLPIRPTTQGDPGSSEAQLMVQGGQNQATPYGGIPVVLGKVRMTPPLGMNSFVTFDNVGDKSTSFLNMMLVWGYGPLSIDENSFLVGKTNLSDYSGVVQETLNYQATPGTGELENFANIVAGDVVQNYSGLELVAGGYRSVARDVNQTVWNSTYNNGQYYMRQRSVSGTFPNNNYYSTWTPLVEGVEEGDANNSNVVQRPQQTSEVFQFVGGTDNWTESTFTQSLQRAVLAISFPQGLRKIKVKTGKTEAHTVEFQVQYRYRANATTWETNWTPLTNVVITRNEKDGFTHVVPYNLLDITKLGIQYRIKRVTDSNGEPNEDDRLAHTSILHSFTGYSDYNEDGVPYPAHSWAPKRPVNTKVCKTAIKIQATDQLNGNIEGISALVQTICPVWNGSNWVDGTPTSNPAALFRYVLTHPANPQRVEASEINTKIDLAALQDWYNYCQNYQIKTGPSTFVSKALEYNSVLSQQKSVLEVLRDICAAGRASPAMKDGKWTVTIDREQSTVVQHFTPHNSWGFESVKALPRYPHAFKVQFLNEQENYQPDEIVLPATGYTAQTAELFETISLPGITNKDLALDFARWHYAQIKLRPEIFTLNTDIEYLVCNRGDRVKVLHDVPMWGLQSGRIKNRLSGDIFELDEELPVTENKNYTIRFRGVSDTTGVLNTERQLKTTFAVTNYNTLSGNRVVLTIGAHPLKVGDRVAVTMPSVTVGSATVNLSLSTAVISAVTATTITYVFTSFLQGQPLTAVTGTIKLKDGYYTKVQITSTTTNTEAGDNDLFMFGELQQESQDLVVLAIEPTSGAKNARITLVDYGVQPPVSGVTNGYNIFTDYWNYTGLAYFSNISGIPQLQLDDIGDRTPVILSDRIVSDETVMTRLSTDTFVISVLVPFVADFTLPRTVTHVQGQIDLVNGNETYKLVSTEIDKSSITFDNVEEQVTYRIRLRYVAYDGRVGGWSDWVTHNVVGKFTPPPNVANFSYIAQPGGVKFTWDKPNIPDYKTTIIKDITGANWATGTTLFEGAVDTWTWTNVATNNYVIAARHLDQANLLSNTAATLNISYIALELAAVKVELDNDTHNIPAKEDGTDPVLGLSGTDIEVYQGGSLLKYDAVGTANGRWRIVSAVGTNCTPGAIAAVVNNTTGDNYARIADLTAFSTTQDTGQIIFTISGKTTTGVVFNATKTQTFAKVKNAQDSTIYRIVMSTKAVYKNSPDNTTPGTFDPITGGARKYVGNTVTNFGYLGITPYIGNTAGTESRVFVGGSDGVIFSPTTNDQSTRYLVKLYETDTSTTVLDTEFIAVIFKGNAATRFSIDNAAATFAKDKAGVISPSGGITLTTSASNFTISSYQWQKNSVNISGANGSSYVVPTSDYSSVNTNTYRCNATGTINGVADQILNDSITIPRLDDGTSSPTVVLSNENVTFSGPLSGYSGITFTGGDCTVTAYLGTVQLTYNTTGANTFSVSQSTTEATVAAGTAGANSYSVPAPTAMSSDTAYTDVTVTIRDGTGTALASTITKRISYSLSRKGDQGNPSTVPGATGPRTAQIYYYYTTNSNTPPTAPTTSEVSYNFSTSAAASSNSSWVTTFPAPAPTVTSSNNKYWAILVTFSESSFGGSQNTPAISAPFNWLNFDGLVTFTNLAERKDATGNLSTTMIDGGAIKTNTITVDSLKAGTSAVSGGRTFGLGIGAVVNAQQAAVVGSAIRVDVNTPNNGVSGGAFSTTTNNGYGLLAGCVDGTVSGAVVTGSAIGAYNATSSAFSTFNTQVTICNKDQLLFGFKTVPGTSATLSDATLASNLHGASLNFYSADSPYNRISTAILASSTYAGNFQYRNASNNTALTSADIATATHSFIGVGDMSVNGSIFATGNVVGYSSSDIRYKTKIKPLNNSLNALCAIDGISFEWTDEFYNKIPKISRKLVKRKDIGIIAQQVKKVFPQIVNTDADGMLAVNYEKLVPVLIEAIKELKLKVEVLEGKQNVQL